MSVDGDNTTAQLSERALLQAILVQLKLQTEILKEISGIEIKEEDLDV